MESEKADTAGAGAVKEIPKYKVRAEIEGLRKAMKRGEPILPLSVIARLCDHIERLLNEGDELASAGEGVVLWAADPYNRAAQKEHRDELERTVEVWRGKMVRSS